VDNFNQQGQADDFQGVEDFGELAGDQDGFENNNLHELEDIYDDRDDPGGGANQDRSQSPEPTTSQIKDIQIALDFIKATRCASLDDATNRLGKDATARLRNPGPIPGLDLDDPDLLLSIKMFLSVSNASQETYNTMRQAFIERHPEDKILTYDKVKRRVAQITGVYPLIHDMCIGSCIAYTGPFSDLIVCPTCSEPRYDQNKFISSNGETRVPRQTYYTLPIGPQIQAFWQSKDSADKMRHRERETARILRELQDNGGRLLEYNDVYQGSDYLDAVKRGNIRAGDTLLMLSMDGAQLYKNKSSDCWIYIWVILDLAPDLRYKKHYVMPGGFIPKKPGNVDSFLFPGMHHLSAIQKEGLRIWDATDGSTFVSRPFLGYGTADGPGVTYLNGLVGHQGRSGCRLSCPMVGRHKPGCPHYYPARLKPHNYAVSGCDHDDVEIPAIPQSTSERYLENLEYLRQSPNQTQYKARRLETGISKPTIFSGLPPQRVLGIPGCFGSDIMHLTALNIPDLLISLWCGTMNCEKTDNKDTWTWATLQGNVWKEHGQQVADATPYLPGSFDRPPRNPVEKINSGYKAWEHLMYIYGLGPGVFYGVLPEKYWVNFCRLVAGIRLVLQRKITQAEVKKAHVTLSRFAIEFEQLYYQRRTDRLHFVRPCIHGITHLAPEITRLGPGVCLCDQ
jgi:hypothetical protein